MPDTLEKVRGEIKQRIAALKPAVDEYALLQAAMRALSDLQRREERGA